MANQHIGTRCGLTWGLVCAVTLMAVRPVSLVQAWGFHDEPGWWASMANWIAPHVMLVAAFTGIGRLIERDGSRAAGWQMAGVAGVVWLGYVLVVLGMGWVAYLMAPPAAPEYRMPMLGMEGASPMRQWATSLVLDIMPVRALGIAACLFALARELRVRNAAPAPTP